MEASISTQRKFRVPTTGFIRMKALLALTYIVAGCQGNQSWLNAQGPDASAIARISWVMFIGALAILTLVMVLSLLPLMRSSKRPRVSSRAFIVAGGIVLPVAVLTPLLIYGVMAMGSIRTTASPALRIEIVAHRWWWQIQYRDASGVFTTANEIRIPAGEPVEVILQSHDVIHSFWVPTLAGKMDVIPGRTNRMLIQADRPGTYRGQCAEYCGAQHARMAFHVVAEEPSQYSAWLANQRRSSNQPADSTLAAGRDAFVQRCVQCHTVRGVGQASSPGPDLTHFASRKFIAAGTLENRPDNIVRFITDAQQVKPGSAMPSFRSLDDGTVNAIAAYVGSLE